MHLQRELTVFERTGADWDRLNAQIDLTCALAKAEIRAMADAARDQIDVRLGFSASFIRRSRAQRARFARQRQLQEVTV